MNSRTEGDIANISRWERVSLPWPLASQALSNVQRICSHLCPTRLTLDGLALEILVECNNSSSAKLRALIHSVAEDQHARHAIQDAQGQQLDAEVEAVLTQVLGQGHGG